mgnify:CR=1 FL=1
MPPLFGRDAALPALQALIDRQALKLAPLCNAVLDEAHRMPDTAFLVALGRTLQQPPAPRRPSPFSATYPEEVRAIGRRFKKDPVPVTVADRHDGSVIRQQFHQVEPSAKPDAVIALLLAHRPQSCLVFCNTRIDTRNLVNVLWKRGVPAIALHGDLEQREREEALLQFANGSCRVLVATDVAARGNGLERQRDLGDALLRAVEAARHAGFTVAEDFAVSSREVGSPGYLAARMAKAFDLSDDIAARVVELLEAEERVAQRISTANIGLDPAVFKDAPGDVVDDLAERRENQLAAFRQLFGRDPVDRIDWSTAAALDPHTYDAIFDGTGSQVQVVRINPIPGQGEVRVSQWIPQRDVIGWPIWTNDLGNNRGPDPQFHPEDTKVTTYIDYENGVVVMRQNPSVMAGTGEVRVGKPAGSVSQRSDGSVRIRYDAGNPFAPGPSTSPTGPMAGHQMTVNGDLVFSPGAGGVRVDGTRTDYPSMEVYQDMPDGTTRTVLIDPADSGLSLIHISEPTRPY